MPYLCKASGLLAAASLLLPQSYAVATNSPLENTTAGFPQCDALIQAGLGDRLILPIDPEYGPRIESWWSMNSRLHPWCIVQPRDAAEVSKTLTTLLEFGDGAGDWHIAVRSGGHGLGGVNNVDNGVTIDLSHLNRTTYDKETNTASIGTGGKWMNVYAELHEQNVLVTGGRDGDVGVGGFLLGGGMTYFMGRHGFGCDYVKNFEVALTNGSIVNANKDENSDLWKALKGGGSNFGIVTRFDMEALPDNPLAYGVRIMSGNYSSELADAAIYFTDHLQEHDGDALIMYLTHDTSISPEDVTAIAIHTNVDGVHNSTGFRKLNGIPSLVPDETISVSLAEAARDSQVDAGLWNAQGTISFKNDKRIVDHAVKLHAQYVNDMKEVLSSDDFVTMFFFQPLPTLYGELSKQRGGNMLGTDVQEHNAILFTAGVSVKTSQDLLPVAQSQLHIMISKIKAFASSVDGDNNLVFMNYADVSQDSLGSYGKANVDHIKQVAAKYDPKGLFQTRVPGGFKISRVE